MAHEYFKVGTTQALINAVKALTAEKPDSDAFSPLLTAGAALGITGNDAEESAWLTRTSTADGVASVRSIHGRTLVWNQLCRDNVQSQTSHGITQNWNSDGSVTINGTADAASKVELCQVNLKANHIYLLKGCPSGGSASTYWMNVGGLGADYGSGSFLFYGSDSPSRVRIAFASGVTFDNVVIWPQLFDLTAMFGAGSEPSTIEEFTALYPADYYPYDAGSLLPVNMTGIETVGFNQLDPAKVAALNGVTEAAGVFSGSSAAFRTAMSSGWEGVDYITGKQYEMSFKVEATDSGVNVRPYVLYTDGTTSDDTAADSSGIAKCVSSAGKTVDHFSVNYSNTGNISISQPCINLSDPTRNGEYAPHWQQTRSIPAGTLRGAGSVYDELTETAAITRVGVVDLGTLTWTYNTSSANPFFAAALAGAAEPNHVNTSMDATCTRYLAGAANYIRNDADYDKRIAYFQGYLNVRDSAYTDAAAFKTAMSGVMLHYALATPTVTAHEQPLNMTYRTEQGGTERVMVPAGEQSAPPTIVTAQGYTAESLRDAALSAIAPVENGLASANYGVGAYLVHGGQLCKVTMAIATGEAITIGTNVTTTTVMAEVIALTQ